MGETITITLGQTTAISLLTAAVGAVLTFFFTKRRDERKCEQCPEHKEHQDRIAAIEASQAALDAKMEMLCERVAEVHDMMFQFLGRASRETKPA